MLKRVKTTCYSLITYEITILISLIDCKKSRTQVVGVRIKRAVSVFFTDVSLKANFRLRNLT